MSEASTQPAAAAASAATAAAGANAAGEELNNPVVFFDVDISGYYAGRIEITVGG